MIVSLQDLPSLVSLVPGSGLQFLDFGININAAKTTLYFWNKPAGAKDQSGVSLVVVQPDPHREGQFSDGDSHAPDSDVYSVSAQKAVDAVLARWVPLPFLRIRDHAPAGSPIFAEGPTNWARVRIVALATPDEMGNTHRITLAFDTLLVARREGRPYSAPAPDDAKTGAEFALAHNPAAIAWFLKQEWIDEWLADTLVRSRRAQRPSRRSTEPESPFEHWAHYLTLLELLRSRVSLPRIAFVDTVSTPNRYSPINVDFALDVGNSRTCGILIESVAGEKIGLNSAYPLELRDLTDPSQVHVESFPSRIEFVRPSFGNERLARRSGRSDSFAWPSAVRVGFEAARLSNLLVGTEGNSGLSSPKRYLWDGAPVSHDWHFNRRADPDGGDTSVASDPRAQRFREDGEVRKPTDSPLINARFSRGSLMTMFLCEILVQVFVAMNSPSKRYQRAHSEVPRRLNRIILTMPTAMPLAERERFRRRAKAANDLVWKEMGRPDDVPPDILMQWDEATGTQAVFLYSEIENNFNGRADEFFKCGNRKQADGEAPSLRIASIDIGGGTTDLIITNYRLDGEAILPKQEFREGFNFAGDDILCGLIERHVLRSVHDAMRNCGVDNAAEVLARCVGDNRAGMTELDKTLRKLFANQIAIPLALYILHKYENYDPAQGAVVEIFNLAKVLGTSMPSPEVVAYLETPARERGGKNFHLADIEFRVDLAAIDITVQRLIREILGDLSEVIHLYDCDYLLLSGRPSRLPAVKATILARLPVMADRIHSMHRYRVGGWYAFRDAFDRLADPKSTAAVGAMVCALSEGQLQDFHLRSREMKMVSTARYVGVMGQNGQILKRKEFFRNIDLEDRKRRLPAHTFDFLGPTFIGFRQLEAERWPATALYFLAFTDAQIAQRYKLPLKVTIEQASDGGDDPAEDEDDFRITEVTDADGEEVPRRVVLQRLQTLRDDAGYWTDTGIFDIPSGGFDLAP